MNTFRYTYSAKQQEEIESIRQKYLEKEESKIEQLRRLDRSVTSPGTAASLTVGITCTLLFGFGMACVLEWQNYLLGFVTGIVGAVGIALAYPIFKRITKKQREKIAPRILKLTEELSGITNESSDDAK